MALVLFNEIETRPEVSKDDPHKNKSKNKSENK